MMSIEQADKIDGMGVDTHNNELVLLISDHLSWEDEKAHVFSLENKLSGYIDYINSGQYLEPNPQFRGMSVRIKLVHKHSPTSSARTILQAVEVQLEAMSIRFSYEPLPSQY